MAVMDIIVRAVDKASETIESVGRKGEKAMEGFSDKAARVGGSMEKAGKKASLFVTLPVIGAMSAATDKASDLNESVNAVSQTYDKINLEKITALGDTSAQTMGLSTAAFNGFAVQFAGFADKIAGEGGDTAGVIEDVGTRVADFASVMNLDVNTAAGEFQSIMAGSSEVARKYGLDVGAAAVEQFALENGIADSASEMTEAQKIQARYGILMQQTEKWAGDFAATSTEVANAERITAAEAENAAAQLGQNLIPVKAKLIEMLGKVVDWFNNLSPAMQQTVLGFAAAAAAVGPVLIVGGKLVTAFGQVGKAFGILSKLMMTNPWLLLIAAVIALVTIIVTNWDKIVAFLKKTWEWISTTASKIWNGIKDFFSNLFGKIWDTIKNTWNNVIDFFKGLPGKAINALAGFASSVFNWIVQNHPIAILFRKVKEVWPQVRDWFKSIPGKVIDAIGNVTKLLFDIGKRIIQGLWDGLKAMWDKVTGWFGGIGDWIADHKGPAEVDARLLTPNGRLIMAGLLKGLQQEWPKVADFVTSRAGELELGFGNPQLAASGMGRMGGLDLLFLLQEQNDLLKLILNKIGISIDGRELAAAIGRPLVDEIRSRTGL